VYRCTEKPKNFLFILYFWAGELNNSGAVAYMETTEQNSWPRLLKSGVILVDSNVFAQISGGISVMNASCTGKSWQCYLTSSNTDSLISCGWTELSR